MQFREIISMAMQSLGANKLRSGLTMVGITFAQAIRYQQLMEGIARDVCLKCFDFKGQCTYNGLKTPPALTVAGSNKSFLAANSYTLGYGRNLTDEDVDLGR